MHESSCSLVCRVCTAWAISCERHYFELADFFQLCLSIKNNSMFGNKLSISSSNVDILYWEILGPYVLVSFTILRSFDDSFPNDNQAFLQISHGHQICICLNL